MALLVNLEQLKVATGYDRPGDVEKCLRKNGVRFLYRKSGIYTTMDALNAAMGLKTVTIWKIMKVRKLIFIDKTPYWARLSKNTSVLNV